MICCCLCSAIGESNPGRVPEGGGVPLCPEHRARSIEQSRKPAPPQIIMLGLQTYEDACAAAVLDGRPVKSLASLAALVPPTSTTLQ